MATQTQVAPKEANDKHVHIKDKSNEATNGSLTTTGMRCPDPSAHKTKNSTLQDHASAAALYSTKSASVQNNNPLGPDGKLSSASAATSLKQARAQDLPSFPVVGIDTASSANSAANLANSNKKSPEWWKPEQSAAAGKAALLANDYKMAPLWQPEASTAGSKAALLAHKDGPKLSLWQPEPSSAGSSAATLAFRNQSTAPVAYKGSTEDEKKKALVAATGAFSSSAGRRRARSTPAPPPLFPDQENSARNALSAATLAHAPSVKSTKSARSPIPSHMDSDRLGSPAMEAARIQHSKSTSRQMYTEHPPVAIEVDEQNRQNALKASAISMAKQMYGAQQKAIDEAAGRASRTAGQTAATAAAGSQGHSSEADIKQQAMQYIHVQEAAQRLAAERLAKIESEHENAAFRSYYGYDKPKKSKLSIRRPRGRASSNPETADSSSDDEMQSRRIRSQMSQLNKSLAEVDKKKEQDRKNLMAAAQRKVQAQMHGLDEKIFNETGKMSPAMIEEWDAKARAKAAADSEARMVNHGKVHVGGGKFLDQSEIDAVAAARIQPTLDEINEKTEKQRAREEETRLDQEEKRRQAQIEKERAAELKAEEKRIKDEEKKVAKTRTTEEKAAAKQEKEAEKSKKAEEKRLAKEEKRKSKDAPRVDTAIPDEVTSPTEETATEPTPTAATQEERDDELYRPPEPTTLQPPREIERSSDPTSPTSPLSPTSPSKSDSKGFKSFLNKFKRRSKHEPGFIGGFKHRHSISSNPSSQPQSPKVEATGGSAPAPATQGHSGTYSDVSSLSSDAEDEGVKDRGRGPERSVSGISAASSQYSEARDGFDEGLAPPPSFTTSDVSAARKGSPNRDSKFHEIGI